MSMPCSQTQARSRVAGPKGKSNVDNSSSATAASMWYHLRISSHHNPPATLLLQTFDVFLANFNLAKPIQRNKQQLESSSLQSV